MLLAQHFGSMLLLMEAGREELLSVHGVGEKMVDALLDYFSNPYYKKMVMLFLDIGMPPTYICVSADGILSGQTVLITGSLQGLTRDEAKDKITLLGGRVVSQVSRSLTILIVGEKPGSKLQKVRVLNEKGANIRIEYGVDFLSTS